MDAKTFLTEFNRMCQNYKSCNDCMIAPSNNGTGESCWFYSILHPESAVSAVEQWSSEHPEKTRLQDFLEKYPKAHLCKNGFPPFRPAALGYCGESICSNCKILDVDCWNMPLDE